MNQSSVVSGKPFHSLLNTHTHTHTHIHTHRKPTHSKKGSIASFLYNEIKPF